MYVDGEEVIPFEFYDEIHRRNVLCVAKETGEAKEVRRYSPRETYFDAFDPVEPVVKKFMQALIEKKIEEFKRMRDALNPKWKELAEQVRLEKIEKYTF